jgi:hypothetical protein
VVVDVDIERQLHTHTHPSTHALGPWLTPSPRLRFVLLINFCSGSPRSNSMKRWKESHAEEPAWPFRTSSMLPHCLALRMVAIGSCSRHSITGLHSHNPSSHQVSIVRLLDRSKLQSNLVAIWSNQLGGLNDLTLSRPQRSHDWRQMHTRNQQSRKHNSSSMAARHRSTWFAIPLDSGHVGSERVPMECTAKLFVTTTVDSLSCEADVHRRLGQHFVALCCKHSSVESRLSLTCSCLIY